VQTHRDQQPVGRAVEEATPDVIGRDELTETGQSVRERGVDQAKQHTEDQRHDGGDDWYEPAPTEEGEIAGQRDPVVGAGNTQMGVERLGDRHRPVIKVAHLKRETQPGTNRHRADFVRS